MNLRSFNLTQERAREQRRLEQEEKKKKLKEEESRKISLEKLKEQNREENHENEICLSNNKGDCFLGSKELPS